MKTAKRSREKTRLEYDEDFRQLKDTLRGSIICGDMNDVWIVWKALKRLEVGGVLKVLQVKNRYRGPPMPGGYRDINVNVRFDGIICEVQIHTAGHYALKRELHPSYKLCRSVGLVGDIEGINRNGSVANDGPRQRHKTWLVTAGIAFLRCWFAIALALVAGSFAGGKFASMRALDYAVEDEGWARYWQGLSLAIPCWLLSSRFIVDLWDTSRVAFAGFLLNIGLALFLWHLWLPTGFWHLANETGLAFCVFVLVVAVLLRRQLWHQGSEKEKLPRIALLYSLYFGVDGTHFVWKSAIQQCLTVGIQAYIKLNFLGAVVSTTVSMAMYWTLFATLVGNAVLPPLLLSSPVPRVRREGAMCFDVACDLFYTVGVNAFYVSHTVTVDGLIAMNIVAYLSFILPCLRVLSVVKTLEKISWSTLGDVKPSRLSRKAAIGFGLLSLAGFTVGLMVANRDVYPWNANVCRPCQCSDDLVLESCNFDGRSLALTRRGITGIKAGALDGAPDLKQLILSLNDITMLPSSAFVGKPSLEVISVSYNSIKFLDVGALRNLTQLAELWLDYNSFSSPGSFNGGLSDLSSLEILNVAGNRVSCKDLQFEFGAETWCSD